MNLNKELTEAFGMRWHGHEACPNCGYYCTGKTIYCTPPIQNPDFISDSRLVLREMRKIPNYHLFLKKIYVDAATPEEILDRSIVQLILDKTGKLAQLALDWLKEVEDD